MAQPVLLQADLPGLRFLGRGKVRDMYDLGDSLLIVTTDRLSAFDVVMGNGIPDKGRVLNRISEFWFGFLGVRHHLITCDVDRMPDAVKPYRELLRGRAMHVRKAKPFPVECVARGYLIGSGWKDYQTSGAVCGIRLPAGLRQAAKLPEPIFTPATKAQSGHDENIGFDEAAKVLGADVAAELRERTLSIYRKAAAYSESRGVILADTKFEFGLVDGEITLIDEVLTPDSSRYWPREGWKEGTSPPSYDKQFVRDYLESIRFDKRPPGPILPDDVVQKTRDKYREAFRVLTGRDLDA
jgi:phosphoribosylaminoimidazole-succinocarboxamide synthase